MTRWALLLEYAGTGFVGWQRQENGLALQQILEAAAGQLEQRPVSSICAGRTDSGVHAEGQVVHIDLERDMTPESLLSALNYHMKPHPIVVRQAAAVLADFSARFSALGRSYRYTILNRRARPALLLHRVWHVPPPLDACAMAEAARHLLGRHDFSSFRAAACQAQSALRTLDRLDVIRRGESIDVIAEARSFLHHQVRNMVGTLRLVGDGSWPASRVAEVLQACDRTRAGPTAPAAGLTLTQVRYDPDPFGRSTENSGAG
jgi:tRNA pseudouridine38-40 synthase